MVAMMVRPSRERARRMATTSSAILASSPEVGSSTRRTGGLVRSSRPMLTRLRCPPERPRSSTEPMRVWLSSGLRRSCASTASARARLPAAPSLAGRRRCAA
mmetsp:Transcript_14135/g.42824  ORF Transcript_14135/g.42824 Transcript_14135/m.42824 type:complete len:102 (-) Transcript_14135:397-702(-)